MPTTNSIDDWLSWMRTVRRCTTGTITVYRGTMVAFEQWVTERHPSMTWQTIDAPVIEGFLGRVRPNGGLAQPATQQRERATIKSFYTYLQRRGTVTSDPLMDVPIVKVSNRHPKAISDDTWRQLWLSEVPREDRVWLGLGCFAGLRRREIVSLAPSQIDHERGLLFGVQRKGGALDVVEFEEMARIIHQRLPHVLPDLEGWLTDVRWLCEARRSDRTLITCGEPATTAGRAKASLTDTALPDPVVLNRQLVRLLRHSEMPTTAFTPHALRHTAATNLLRCGIPIEVVADCLGHSTTAMTMRYSKTAGRLSEWRTTIS